MCLLQIPSCKKFDEIIRFSCDNCLLYLQNFITSNTTPNEEIIQPFAQMFTSLRQINGIQLILLNVS
jgi:hypothetical protein